MRRIWRKNCTDLFVRGKYASASSDTFCVLYLHMQSKKPFRLSIVARVDEVDRTKEYLLCDILRKDWCVHKGGARNIKTLRLVHDWPWSWRGVRYPGLVRSQPGFSQRRRSVAYASLMPVPDVDCYYLLPIARNASIKRVKLDLCDIN